MPVGYPMGPGYPGAPASAWTRAPGGRAGDNPLFPLVALLVGAAAGLGYAAWALFHRRAVFEDFASGTSTMSIDDARASDNIDSALLVVAFLVIAAAVAWWVVLRITGRSGGGPLEMGGLAAVGLGLVLAVIGLIMSTGVSSDGTQQDEGDKAASAAVLYGLGFAVVAVGLIIGAVSLRRWSAVRASLTSG